MMIATFVIAPFGEELFFRGVIMGYAKRYMPPAFAILFQGVLFGLYHGNIVQASMHAFFRMSAWICGLQSELTPRKHDPAFQYQPECALHSIRMV